MSNGGWDNLPRGDGNRERLAMAVAKLGDVHGRKLSAVQIQHWVSRLTQHAENPILWRILAEACDGARMPAVSDVLDAIAAHPKAQARVEAPPTPGERLRSNHAAVLSMLWLHYAKNWQLRDFAGTIMASQFGKDPYDALVAAKELYDKPTILAWMANQEQAGN